MKKLKIVRFKSPESPEVAEEMATKIEAHLYDVTRKKYDLIFSKFDESAFECAIGLEGLRKQDYYFVDSELNIKGSGIAPVYFGEPQIILELTIGNATRTICHHFRLLVCNTFQPSDDLDEIPLAINPELLYFATFVKRVAEKILEPIPIIDGVTNAVCIKNGLDLPISHILKIERNGETQLYRFFLTELTIHWERERL